MAAHLEQSSLTDKLSRLSMRPKEKAVIVDSELTDEVIALFCGVTEVICDCEGVDLRSSCLLLA